MKKHLRLDPRLQALRQLHLFRNCTDKQLSTLLPDTDLVTVGPGTIIDRSGTMARQLVGLADGFVEALDDDGPTILAAGDHYGAAELLDRRSHRSTYTAITVTSLVVTFGPTFCAQAGSFPASVGRSIRIASRLPIDDLVLVG